MSTKTTLKRIALVAVSALGFGLLSVMPASATPATITADDTAATGATGIPTSVVATLSTPVRTTSTTWTSTVTATIVGTDIASADDVTLGGTIELAAGGAPSGLATTVMTDVAVTINSATSATATGTLTFTAAADSLTGINAAATSYSVVIRADVAQSLTGDAKSSVARTVSLSDSAYFESVSANNYSVTSGSNVTQLAGGVATLKFFPDPDTLVYNITTNFGSISAVETGTAAALTYINGLTFSDGARITYTAGTSTPTSTTIKLISSAVGTSTVTFQPVDTTTGVPGSASTATVNWVSTATAGLSDANTSVAIVSSAERCTYNADKATQDAGLATFARSSMSFLDTDSDTGRKAFICIIARDGNNNSIATSAIDTIILSTTLGSFSSGGVISRVDTSVTTSGNVGTQELYGDALAPGASTVTVTLIEGAVSVTRSLAFTYYGRVAALTLTPVTYAMTAADPDAVPNDYTSATDKSGTAVAFAISATDSGGRSVVGVDINGDGIANDTAWTVTDTDRVAGAPTFVATAPSNAGDQSFVTVTTTIGSGASAVNGYSSYVVVDGDSAFAAAQKLNIRVCVDDAATAGTQATICASGDYYLSGAASTITVTPAATSLAVGASTTVNVSIKDANGYPVGDNTSVTLAATNGSVIAPATKSTENGAFATAASFVAGSQGASSIVSAIVGSKSGTATIAITGGAQDAAEAAADAAAEAIDAANAATDAANLAAEAADAATVAAEEARDAADAATAAVEELSTQVATLMAALRAQITTLANTVAKIAKKVRA